MNRLFQTDSDRDRAVALQRVLSRLTDGEGEDKCLGADIADAVGMSPAILGDPTSCIDCAMALTTFCGFSEIEILAASIKLLRERGEKTGKRPDQMTAADAARAVATITIREVLAKIGRVPA